MKILDHLSVNQRKEALDDAIYRAVIRFESETGFTILGVNVSRLDVGADKTTCTSVSTEVKNRWL